MLAAVYRGNREVKLEELPVPEIGSGELLVRVAACGVCGTDLKKVHLDLVPPPRIFGHEIAGTVERVAPGESDWRPGDRVVVQHHIPCRSCYYCRRRLYSNCPGYRRTGLTAGFDPAGGGFAEFVRVMPFVRPGVVRIPDGIPFDVASFLEPLNTVLKGVSTAAAETGELAVVFGQGPIGLLFTQVLHERGLEVLGVDPIPGRRALAESFGAMSFDPAVPNGARELARLCRNATEGRGADLAVVAVAHSPAITDALEAVRPGGRVLLFAQTRLNDCFPLDAGQVCAQEKALLGSYSADIDLQEQAADWLFSGKIQVAPLITHRLPLARISEALETAAHPGPHSLKVVVCP
jgi:L-iditol 2-dehydrogenase